MHSPGVGACLADAHEAKLSNLRVMCHDAVEVLENMIPDGSLDMVQLFFPIRGTRRATTSAASCKRRLSNWCCAS